MKHMDLFCEIDEKKVAIESRNRAGRRRACGGRVFRGLGFAEPSAALHLPDSLRHVFRACPVYDIGV